MPQECQGRFDGELIARKAAIRAQCVGFGDETAADDFFFAAVPTARVGREDADLRGQADQAFEFDAGFGGPAGDLVVIGGREGFFAFGFLRREPVVELAAFAQLQFE